MALPLPGTKLKVFWSMRVIYDIGYQDIRSQCTRVRLLFYNNDLVVIRVAEQRVVVLEIESKRLTSTAYAITRFLVLTL